MRCKQCEEEGQESEVKIMDIVTTSLATRSFYDRRGRYHYHDPNTTTTTFLCSNGHQWAEWAKSRCPNPACNYNEERKDG